jgi:hypothetical protein
MSDEQNETLIVVFGAGASYDSDSARRPGSELGQWPGAVDARPPLANQLFEHRFSRQVAQRTYARALIPRLREVAEQGGSIEQELGVFAVEARQDPRTQLELLDMQEYIRSVIMHVDRQWMELNALATNYLWLLRHLRMWTAFGNRRVLFLTFNYDRLLDNAFIDALGIRLDTIDSYVLDPTFKLIKLHGSTHWYRRAERVGHKLLEVVGIGNPRPVDGIAPYDLEWTTEYAVNRGDNTPSHIQAYFPAIAIPTVEKSDFQCPPAHLETAKEMIRAATHLLVVGWQGQEEHFHRVWRDNRPPADSLLRFHVVDKSPEFARRVGERLREQMQLDPRPVEVTGGFSQFLASEPPYRSAVKEFFQLA